MSRNKSGRFASFLVALLIALAFASAPYHSHPSNADSAAVVLQANSDGSDHGQDFPTEASAGCTGCVLMKEVQTPVRHAALMEAPLQSGLTMKPTLHPGCGPWTAFKDLFRPPIQIQS